MNKTTLTGYLYLSIGQFCIGANIILGKFLMDSIPICALLFIRFSIGFILPICFGGLKQFSNSLQEVKMLQSSEWLNLFLQALCAGFLFNVFTLSGLQYTTATTAGIINSGVPALVAVFSFFILKERLSKEKIVAILLCIVGIFVLSVGKSDRIEPSHHQVWGIFLVFLAIIPEALFTILAKLLKSPISSRAKTLLANGFNALLFIPLALTNNMHTLFELSALHWLLIVTYALGSIFFFTFWYQGLKHISANTAALFMGVMPISTTLLAYLFLNETLTLYDSLGMLFIMSSLFLGTYQRSS